MEFLLNSFISQLVVLNVVLNVTIAYRSYQVLFVVLH